MSEAAKVALGVGAVALFVAAGGGASARAFVVALVIPTLLMWGVAVLLEGLVRPEKRLHRKVRREQRRSTP